MPKDEHVVENVPAEISRIALREGRADQGASLSTHNSWHSRLDASYPRLVQITANDIDETEHPVVDEVATVDANN